MTENETLEPITTKTCFGLIGVARTICSSVPAIANDSHVFNMNGRNGMSYLAECGQLSVSDYNKHRLARATRIVTMMKGSSLFDHLTQDNWEVLDGFVSMIDGRMPLAYECMFHVICSHIRVIGMGLTTDQIAPFVYEVSDILEMVRYAT